MRERMGQAVRSLIRFHVVICIFFPLASPAAPIPGDFPFTFESIDSIPWGSRMGTSIALDSHGDPHILYWGVNDLRYELRYAYKKSGHWSMEIVPHSAVKPDPDLSLVMDSLDQPHISFSDGQCFSSGCVSGIWYGVKTDGTWQLSLIDGSGDYVSSPTLALDAQGKPHVAYLYFGRLEYAVLEGATWNIEEVFVQSPSLPSASHPSLAIDPGGTPLIGFFENWENELRVLRWTGAGWHQETVDTTGDVQAAPSLKLDTSGNIDIAYLSTPSFHLKFAHQESGTWVTELVDTSGYFHLDNPLALGGVDGSPHILYRDLDSHSLKYAIKKHGAWAIENVNAPGSDPQFAALVLDAEENPRWTYLDVAGRALWYTDGAIHLTYPTDGDVWGRSRAILRWDGQGPVDAFVSEDGQNYSQVGKDLLGGEATIRLPPVHPRIYRVLLRRESPLSTSTANVNSIVSPTPVALAASPLPYRSGHLSISMAGSGESGVLGRVQITVQDVLGRQVRRIAEMDVQGIFVVIDWDGLDDQGHRVGSGTYFLRAATSVGVSSLPIVTLHP